MPAQVTVSVAIVTYNHEGFIQHTLNSVLAQRVRFPYEIVVGEDCSTDNTRRVLQEFQQRHASRLHLLLQPSNLGPRRNFIATLNRCRGKYIALLDGDDYWTSPDKLQTQVNFLDLHPSYAMCGHELCPVDTDGRRLAKRKNSGLQRRFTLHDLIVDNRVPASSVMFRNGLVTQFPDWYTGDITGDWALHILNAQHGDLYMFPEELGAYRVHEQSMTRSQTKSVHHCNLATRAVLDKWLDPPLRKYNSRGYVLSLLRAAKFFAATEEQQAARECFWQGVKRLSRHGSLPLYQLCASALQVYAPNMSRTLLRWRDAIGENQSVTSGRERLNTP